MVSLPLYLYQAHCLYPWAPIPPSSGQKCRARRPKRGNLSATPGGAAGVDLRAALSAPPGRPRAAPDLSGRDRTESSGSGAKVERGQREMLRVWLPFRSFLSSAAEGFAWEGRRVGAGEKVSRGHA